MLTIGQPIICLFHASVNAAVDDGSNGINVKYFWIIIALRQCFNGSLDKE